MLEMGRILGADPRNGFLAGVLTHVALPDAILGPFTAVGFGLAALESGPIDGFPALTRCKTI